MELHESKSAEEWRKSTARMAKEKSAERQQKFVTSSDIEIPDLSTEEALKDFDRNVVVDGEVVSLDEHGFSRFQYLQNWQRDAQGELVYYVFDLLWLDGYDLTSLPLTERKKILHVSEIAGPVKQTVWIDVLIIFILAPVNIGGNPR